MTTEDSWCILIVEDEMIRYLEIIKQQYREKLFWKIVNKQIGRQRINIIRGYIADGEIEKSVVSLS